MDFKMMKTISVMIAIGVVTPAAYATSIEDEASGALRAVTQSVISLVNPKELSQWLKAGEAVVVDVREVVEYNQHHIKGATNLPLSDVSLAHDVMPQHHGKRLVFQCKSGKRSMAACKKIKGEDADVAVWNLEGGILAWMAADLPVEE